MSSDDVSQTKLIGTCPPTGTETGGVIVIAQILTVTVIETEIETAIEIEIGIGRTDATDVEAVPQEAGVVPETGTDRETRTGTGIAIASEIETETVIAIVIVRLDV